MRQVFGLAPPFYGWVMVGVAATVALCQTSFFNPVLGVFIEPLSEKFGWNRATISAAVSIDSVGEAVISPLVGRILDRWGSRLAANDRLPRTRPSGTLDKVPGGSYGS